MPLLKESGMVSGLSRLSWQMLRSQKEIKQVTRFPTGPGLLAKPLANNNLIVKKVCVRALRKNVLSTTSVCVCAVCVCVVCVCVLYVCVCVCCVCVVYRDRPLKHLPNFLTNPECIRHGQKVLGDHSRVVFLVHICLFVLLSP